MVGAAIVRELRRRGYDNLIYRTHKELDLVNQEDVKNFFATEKPDLVYLAAARVGGIYANNTYPAEFIYDNLMIQNNVIHQAFLNGVKKLLFLGSSCIYPRLAPQPITEDMLLSGKLEPTNEPYAIAKIAGIKLCQSYNIQYGLSHGVDFRSVMPTNLYGAGDNYHTENSHVIPALISRFHKAKISGAPKVTIWGSGHPRREFLYVDDMARACVFVMEIPKDQYDQVTKPTQNYLNVGYGEDVTICELAHLVGKVVAYTGFIEFDPRMPDGAPRKWICSKRLNQLGWRPEIYLEDGINRAYLDFLSQQNRLTI